jgi:hypothetical protein
MQMWSCQLVKGLKYQCDREIISPCAKLAQIIKKFILYNPIKFLINLIQYNWIHMLWLQWFCGQLKVAVNEDFLVQSPKLQLVMLFAVDELKH